MQTVSPLGQTYMNNPVSGTFYGSSQGPNDGQDYVQASTVLQFMFDSAGTHAYLAALGLGPQNAPPTAQPPAIPSPDAFGFLSGLGSGVQRVYTIDSVASVATTLAALAGNVGDVVALVYGGTGAVWGIYMLIPGTFQTPDAFTVVTQVTVGTGQWVIIAPGKNLITAVGGSSSYAYRLAQLGAAGVLDPRMLPQNSTTTTVFPTPANMYTLVNSGASGQQVNLANGWTNTFSVDNAAFWRDNSGIVHCKGQITSAGSAGISFTFPVGYRPANPGVRAFALAQASGITACYASITGTAPYQGQLTIQLSGGGTMTNGNSVALDGISFLAEA